MKNRIGPIFRKIVNSWWFYIPLFAWVTISIAQKYHPWWVSRTEAFKGAVLGMFSGVVVGVVVFLASKWYESRVKRYNALCNMELILNNLLASLSDNQYQVNKALATDELILIFPTLLVLTEVDLREVGRADLKNKLLEVLIDCRKYKEGLAHAIKLFETQIGTFKMFELEKFSGRPEIIRDILKDFYRQFKVKLMEIREFGTVVERGIEGAVVDTRFFVKRDMLFPMTLNPYYDSRDLERWQITNMEKLKNERQQTAAADDERRKRIESEVPA